MPRNVYVVSGLAVLTALAIACDHTAKTPTSPTTTTAAASDAAADGSTLKVTVPALQAPVDGAQFDKEVRAAALTVTPAKSKYSTFAVGQRFELYKGDQLINSAVVDGGSDVAVWNTGDLDYKTTYTWRVRGENENGAGSWSPTASFTTGDAPPPPPPPPPSVRGGVSREIIIAAANLAPALDPARQSSIAALMIRLRTWGYAASILMRGDGPSDHKVWINGIGWSVVSSDGFRAGTYRWDPYVQAEQATPYNSCGVPYYFSQVCYP